MASEIPVKLSYVNEATIVPSGKIYLYVKDDPAYGLKAPADSGYIVNDGPGTLTVRNSDNGERYTKNMTVNIGETLVWEHEDDELIHTVFLEADGFGVNYRSRFARGKKVV